jgi:hypothetical protein
MRYLPSKNLFPAVGSEGCLVKGRRGGNEGDARYDVLGRARTQPTLKTAAWVGSNLRLTSDWSATTA